MENKMSENKDMNMSLWNEVETSSPQQLKKITFGRGFISIDAHSQIKRATEVFGQIGTGWKFECEIVNDTPENLCIVKVFVCTSVEGREGHTPCEYWSAPVMQYGSAEWKSKNGRVDPDAPKKATTDALTKCLSYLGFNADVFMGQWDNKDIDQAKRAESQEEGAKSLEHYVDIIKASTNMDELKKAYMSVPNDLKADAKITTAKDEMKEQLK